MARQLQPVGTTERGGNVPRGRATALPVAKGLLFFGMLMLDFKAISQPVISKQPKDLVSCVGPQNKEVFEVIATGVASYQWQVDKNTGSFVNADANSLATGKESYYGFPSVELSMTGYKIKVILTGADNKTTVSAVATLTPAETPKILSPPYNFQACEGSEAVFTVGVPSGKKGLVYTWKFKPTGKDIGDPDDADPNSNKLRVVNVSADDEGEYWVEVYNGTCVTSTSDKKARLDIIPKPVVKVTDPDPVCSPDKVDLTNPSVTAGSDAGITFSYFTNRDGASVQDATKAEKGVYFLKGKKKDANSGKTCETDMQEVTATINVRPSLTADPQGLLCSGGTTGIVLDDPTPGNSTLYTWTVSANANITGAAPQPAPQAGPATIEQTLTNRSGTNQSITYTVTPHASPCPDGAPVLFVVEVSNVTAPVVETNPNDQSACSDKPFSIEISSKPPGATFKWKFIPNDKLTGGVNRDELGTGHLAGRLTSSGNTLQPLSYLISAFLNNCYAHKEATVRVKPIPKVKATPPTVLACSGTPSQVVLEDPSGIVGTQFMWQAAAPPSLMGSANQTTPVPGPMKVLIKSSSNKEERAIYTVTPKADGCLGKPIDVPVTVGIPTVFTTQPASKGFCPGEKMELTAVAAGAGNIAYQWKKDGQDIANATASSYSVEAVKETDAGKYAVSAKSGGGNSCANASDEADITVNAELYFMGATVKTSPKNSLSYMEYVDFSYEGPSAALTWDFEGSGQLPASSEKASQLPNPRHYYYAEGKFSAALRAEHTALPGCQKTFTIPIEVTGTQINLYTDENGNPALGAFPNPVRETLYFKLLQPIETASLFDLTGKKWASVPVSGREGSMNVAALPQGIYVLRLKTSSAVVNFKVVKP